MKRDRFRCINAIKSTAVWLVVILGFPLAGHAQTVLSDDSSEVASLSGVTMEMRGYSELHITGGGTPVSGCSIDMTDVDSWVFLHQVKPSVAIGLLGQFEVNGATAVNGTNVRVVQYGQGAVIIPQPADFQPLEVFADAHFGGASTLLSPNTAYETVQSGNISSFILKRGYTATLANSTAGTGGINYVAADGDLKISVLPDGLNDAVNFVRVFPWRWTAKKGTCDKDPETFNAAWNYNWNIDQVSTSDREYVAIRQTRWWPGLDQDWAWRGTSHLLGYNEPDNDPDGDGQDTLLVGDAIWSWPDMEWPGLRIGAPAVTDGGYYWITDFMDQAIAAGRRVDYIPIHYYRASNNNPSSAASALRSYLKAVYDLYHLPMWVTEFNNGANWTGGTDPTFQQNSDCIEAMINMMDDAPWVERYSIYGAVEECRELIDWSGNITPMGAMYRDHVSPIAYQQIIPGKGMDSTAIYSFEDGLDDDSGSGNHAISHNYPDYVSGHGGGTALHFDGVDDHVILPDSLSECSDFSFAAWVKWDGGSSWQRIFDFGVLDSGNKYVFLTPSNGGSMKFVINRGLGEAALSTTALPVGTWTHVAATLSGDTGTLYVNGVQVATGTFAPDPEDLGAIQHYLGRSMFPGDPCFAGALDDVVILDYALSAGDVSDLANSQSVSETVVSLPFDETSGTVAADTSGGGMDGTLVNGPTWATGLFDNSVLLDGSDDYVSLPAGLMEGVEDITISAWVYLTAADMWSRVFDFGTGTSVNMFLTPRSGSGAVRFAIKNGGGEQIINGSSALPTGVWTHVAVTLSGGTGVLYVNGVEVGRNSSMTITPADLGTTTQNYLGKSQYNDPALDGAIDAFEILSLAKSASDIADDYLVGAYMRDLHLYFSFDAANGTTVTDESSSTFDGTLVNGPVLGAGLVNSAVWMDGGNDYVSMPNGVLSGLTDCTLSAWVNLDSVDMWSRVFDFGTGTSVNMFLTPRSGSGVVRFAIKNGGGEQIINGSSALPSGVWTHVAVTLNGSTGILYVDGVEVGRNSSMSITPADLGSTTQNYLGKSQYNDPYLDGAVDEFEIIQRALSAAEVAELFLN